MRCCDRNQPSSPTSEPKHHDVQRTNHTSDRPCAAL
ncbi:Uncharacterised protein [Vibrio cholerae]|nr:Uncharacterised protein [Vibrio cholerae]